MPSSTAAPPQGSSDAPRFELLVDAITDYAIYMLDPDGFVISWNSGAQRVKGNDSGEIIGRHYSRFFTPEDRAAGVPARVLNEAKAAGRSESEGWRVRKDRSRFWAAAVVQPVRDAAGRMVGFAKITRDITERQAAQQALLESERRFRLLVEGVMDYAIYMLDPSGMVVNWNAGAQRLKGYAANEIVGQHFSRFFTRADRAAGLPMRTLEIAAREGRHESEGWLVRKDGSRFWASMLVDAIRNDAGEQRIKGYTAEEIVGQHFSRFYTESERSAGAPARALHTAAQEGRFEAEGWRVRKDGSLFWANAVIDPIRDEAGKLVGYAKITRDITEQREARLALEQAQVQRNYAQKMETLGQLTGGVAHDFNNLLMIVGGHVQTVKQLVAQDPKGTRAAEAIELAARRGESLTRQLLTFSRRQTLNPVVIEIGERIEAVRAMLASSIGPSSKLVTNITPDTWPVKIDPSEFELALINIALNCRDAMAQDGVITITAENMRLRPGDSPQNLE